MKQKNKIQHYLGYTRESLSFIFFFDPKAVTWRGGCFPVFLHSPVRSPGSTRKQGSSCIIYTSWYRQSEDCAPVWSQEWENKVKGVNIYFHLKILYCKNCERIIIKTPLSWLGHWKQSGLFYGAFGIARVQQYHRWNHCWKNNWYFCCFLRMSL